MTYHFLPPSSEEQESVRRFQIGTMIAIVVVGSMLAIPNVQAAPFLIGAMLALMLNFFRVQSGYDKRKKRATKGGITLNDEALHIFDGGRGDHQIKWDDIKSLDTVGGKLEINWSGKKQVLALREIENGMKLLEEINQRRSKLGDAPSNFIPLTPV